MKLKLLLFTALLLSPSPLLHAASKPNAGAPPPAPPAQPSPVLSDVEKLTLENFDLRNINLQLREQILKTQADLLKVQYTAFLAGVSTEHPGYTFTSSGFVKTPSAKPVAKEPHVP